MRLFVPQGGSGEVRRWFARHGYLRSMSLSTGARVTPLRVVRHCGPHCLCRNPALVASPPRAAVEIGGRISQGPIELIRPAVAPPIAGRTARLQAIQAALKSVDESAELLVELARPLKGIDQLAILELTGAGSPRPMAGDLAPHELAEVEVDRLPAGGDPELRPELVAHANPGHVVAIVGGRRSGRPLP
jgi:hypothetical protein